MEFPMGEIGNPSCINESALEIENGENCELLADIQEDTCEEERNSQILYELPPGKKYHLFIAHSAIDGQQALEICKELESRFLLKCMFFDRDFMPAKRIDENIQQEMEKSVKVLLLLSPDFLNSHWCDMEARLAVQMSFDRNVNLRIIPVLLRDLDPDCDLPPFLKPYVCIDAQKEYDCSAKIHEAFYHTGVVDAVHQAELESKFAEDNRNQNGVRLLEMEGRLEKSSCFNASHYVFSELSDQDRSCLSSYKTQEQLENILDFVNSSCFMRNYRILKNGLFQYGFTSLVGLTVTFFYTTIGLLDSFANRDTNGVWTVHIAPGALFGIVSFLLVLFIIRKVRKKLIKSLSKSTWDKNMEYFPNSLCLVLIDVTDLEIPKLVTIRYDITACQEYTCLLLKKQRKLSSDAVNQEAKELILKKLRKWNERGSLVNWASLESEAYNRHNTWLRKSCVCQVLERCLITQIIDTSNSK